MRGALGHIADIIRPDRAALLAAAFAAMLALGGCGGIEFQGKVFDYMGLSGDRKEADPKMAERPPLLLPPDPKALPQPGNGVAVATARQDWPQNPEVVEEKAVQAKKDVRFAEEAKRQPLNPYIGKPNLLTKNMTNGSARAKTRKRRTTFLNPIRPTSRPRARNRIRAWRSPPRSRSRRRPRMPISRTRTRSTRLRPRATRTPAAPSIDGVSDFNAPFSAELA